jgi:transketolase
MIDLAKHKRMANAIRVLAMDAVERANSGHPGLPMGMADVATVLFSQFLKFDPTDPKWPDRDRFVLSAGHGSMMLYALLYLTGYPGMTIDEIKNFRKLHSKTPGHPENFVTGGVEMTTGPLGQGVGTSVGVALAERILAAEYGDDIVDHKTFVICSDGDLMEGVSHEAIALAGHLKLNRLIFLFDDNGITIDGPLTLSDNVDQVARFKAAGWNAARIDGQDHNSIAAAIETALQSDRPTLIACKTTIGFGAPTKAGTSKAHGEALGAEEIAGARRNLEWTSPPFEIPAEILADWRTAGARSKPAHDAWNKRYAAMASDKRAEFDRRFARKRPAGLAKAIADLKDRLIADKPVIATRKASELALDVISSARPT